jgi:putative transposase
VVNLERTYRFHTEQCLQVRTKVAPQAAGPRPDCAAGAGAADAALVTRLHRRSASRFRVLNIVDGHSRFRPGQIVDVSISGARMAHFLDTRREIVLDNGPEGTSRAMFDWSETTGVRLRFIEPGKPSRTPSSGA